MTFWTIIGPLEIFYGHLVYFVVIWYIFPRFGILDQEKSGNPDLQQVIHIVEIMVRAVRLITFIRNESNQH
jgi:hypothetical protein